MGLAVVRRLYHVLPQLERHKALHAQDKCQSKHLRDQGHRKRAHINYAVQSLPHEPPRALPLSLLRPLHIRAT